MSYQGKFFLEQNWVRKEAAQKMKLRTIAEVLIIAAVAVVAALILMPKSSGTTDQLREINRMLSDDLRESHENNRRFYQENQKLRDKLRAAGIDPE